MNDADSELLKRYSGQGDEAAFADLVGRYADLVFSAALRQTVEAGRKVRRGSRV